MDMRTSILLFAILGMVAAPAMAGKDNCSPEMTRGYWAFSCEGYATALPPADPALLPARFFGTCDADRTAYFDCEGTYNVGGQIIPVIALGQGATDKDCTGTITYNEFVGPQQIGQLTIRYTVLDGGDTIWGLPVANAPPSPQVLSCNLRRISK
jgi:hypothetical protein